jgi:CBS-domain-containing membrane protein
MNNHSQPTTPFLVRDLMTVGVLTCSPSDTVQELARLLLETGQDAVVVLDPEDGNALGVVSQDDLVSVYGREGAHLLKAEDVMVEGMIQAPPDIPLTAAAQIMRDKGVRAIFLTHHAGGIIYPAAVLTYTHLLRHLSASGLEDLKDLGIKAARQAPLETYLKRREEARKCVQSKR